MAAAPEVNLKPQPRGAHGDGITLVAFDSKGSIVTGGENKCVYIFKNFEDEEARSIEDNQGAVTAIATRGQRLVTGGEDHIVRLFDLSRTENPFNCIVTRFTAPVRAVAFSHTGSAVAAGGDEMTIKLITLSDLECVELRGHDGAIKSLCFDPQNEYLASASEDGYVRLWSISQQKKIHEQAIVPEARGGSDPQREGMYGLDFDPSGEFLAVAVHHCVQVFDRNLTYRYKLKDLGHETNVSCVKWSPNGQYIASSSIDGTVLVWEVASQQSLNRFKHPRNACITSIAWDPRGDEIAYTDIFGQLGVWRKPVREGDKAKLTAEQEERAQKLQEQEKAAASVEALFDKEDDDAKPKLKRKAKPRTAALDSDDEDGGADGIISSAEGLDDFIVDDEIGAAEGAVGALQIFQQPPFQPSSTPLEHSRRFLVWNDVGIITTREEETTSAVDIEFHDTARHRPIRLVDHFGFTMGALSKEAFVLAAESHEPEGNDTREHPSVLFCRNIGHWATDETWQTLFPPGEEIEAVAVGGGETGFVAAATSLRYVRLYSLQGVARHILCLDGGIVSLAALDAQLMMAYHSGAGVNGDQLISCTVLNIDQQSKVSQTIVPLSARATMTWMGFSETGMPAFADSEEIVRVLMPNWGGVIWTPIVDLKQTRTEKTKSDRYWITGLTPTQLLAVICRGGETYPKVMPKPVVSSIPLRMPVVSFPDTVLHEEKHLRSKLNLDYLVATGMVSELDPADRASLVQQQKQLDAHIIASVSRAVQTQRPARALDLCTMVSQPSNIDVAIKLAVKGKMNMLAERMSIAKRALEVNNRQRLLAKARAARADHAPLPSRGIDSPNDEFSTPKNEDRLRHLERATEGAPQLNLQEEEQQVAAAAEAHAAENAKTAESPSKLKLLGGKKAQVVGTPTTASGPRPIMQNPFAKAASTPMASLKRSDSLANTLKAEKDADDVAAGKRSAKKVAFAATDKEGEETPVSKKSKKPITGKKVESNAAYFLWLKDTRKDLMKKFPGLDAKDLAKKAGEVWAAMTAEERAPWKTKRDLNGKEAETQETQQTQETQATQDTAVTEISTLETTQEVDGTQMDAGEPQPSAIEMEA